MKRDYRITLVSKEDERILGKVDERNISRRVWQHAEHPRNQGILPNPDGQAEVTGICEDTISFQVRLKDDIIDDVCFQANGCGFTVACGSITTELVRDKNVIDALDITGKQIAEAIGGLPRSHIHCADLAANALKAAVRDAL
jgi:nitrogen fixation NifU-like protein